ncbi:MAG: GNAT family N-acetyltransferase [Gammaproteobacteria bacterium]|nr:MAG: GNAT family N-acetyltransferase [Gammaproteobacteria bacterium]
MKNNKNINQHSQPIGEPVPHWQGAKRPEKITLTGKFCRLEPLNADQHAADLYAAFALDKAGKLWTYMPTDPFDSEAEVKTWVAHNASLDDPLFYAIVDKQSDKAVGVAAYLRINPASGCIEVGHLTFSPLLQRTPLATEAMFLMMQYAFDILGYRRYEWKCDSLNSASCKAAKRLGFQFEGTFRQALVYKGRNRDTAWFAIIDKDWQILKKRFLSWLSADNFTANGQQHRRLQDC